ncbi:hypothetical protein JNO12_14835 [Erwinia aphidicola]|nr:hypothetical protein [Erwinia aphidicola]
MTSRRKRRPRHAHMLTSELAELGRINSQLARLQAPVDPDLLGRIDDRLERIESGMAHVHADAVRRGAVAGALAGSVTSGIITTAILLIQARLGM